MAKYINNISFNKTNTGKRFYSTAIPDAYNAPRDVEFTHTARIGDRWDTIAYKYLGSPIYWYVVARANGGIDGSMFIEPGTQIIIPEVV